MQVMPASYRSRSSDINIIATFTLGGGALRGERYVIELC